MSLPDDDYIAALHEVINRDDGGAESRPVQLASPNNDASTAATTTTRTTNKAAAAAANKEETKAAETEENPKPRKRQSAKKLKKDNVQLFAFDPGGSGLDFDPASFGARGRPRRRLKTVARFDSQSYDARASCKTGHGFACPQCSSACSYDVKSCPNCGLPCCYEAGVGVVVLRERGDVTANPKKPKKRSIGKVEGGADSVDPKSTKKKQKKTRTPTANAASAKKGAKRSKVRSSAPAAAKPPSRLLTTPVAKKQLKKRAASVGGSSPSHGGQGKQFLPPRDGGDGGVSPVSKKQSTPSYGGKGKQFLPPQDNSVGSSPSRGGQGKRFLPSQSQGSSSSGSPSRVFKGKRLSPPQDGACGNGPFHGGKGKRLSPPQDDAGGNCASHGGKGKRLSPPQDGAGGNGPFRGGKGKRLSLPQDDAGGNCASQLSSPQDDASGNCASHGGKVKRPSPPHDVAASSCPSRVVGGSHTTGGKRLSPPHDVAASSSGSRVLGGSNATGKRLSPPHDDAASSSGSRVFGGSHATGGKNFERSMGKSLAIVLSPDNLQDTPTEDVTAEKPMGGDSRAVPVVAFYERRPFRIKEYASQDDAKRDLGADAKRIRDMRNYNREHVHPKKRNRGKFKHYDFRDENDSRTARRWQRELLAAEHEDFEGCDDLIEAREHPSWPARLADAHHRMRMGRRILEIMRRAREGASCMLPPSYGKGKCVKPTSSHVSFTNKMAKEETKAVHEDADSSEEEDEDGENDTLNEDDDGAVKDLIVAAIRGKVQPSATSDRQLSEHMDRLKTSNTLDGHLHDDHLAEHDLDHFERSEIEEHHMVNMLNADFPPEDHPPDIKDMTTQNKDLDAKLQETTWSLQIVTEEKKALGKKLEETAKTLQTVTAEKKDLQTKYDTLLTNSMKTEVELRETISTLMGAARERSDSVSSFRTLELEDRLSVVSMERDDLVKKVESMGAVKSESEELARKLEEANAKLELWENIEKENDARLAKENESLRRKLGEKESAVSELAEKLLKRTAERVSAEMKLGIAASDLAAVRKEAAAQIVKITQLESSVESLTEHRDVANTRVCELLSENENANGMMSSLMSERDGLASSVKESKRTIAQLEAEKMGAFAKLAGLEDKVEELLGQIKTISEELNASKDMVKTANGKGSSSESDNRNGAGESNIANKEVDHKSTSAKLEEKIKRQSDDAKALTETVAKSNAKIEELNAHVSKLTAERVESAAKIKDTATELSKLQSAFKTMRAERSVAEAKLQELRRGSADTEEVMLALNSEREVLLAKIDECITRLYSEKEESPSKLNGKSKSRQHWSRWDNGSMSPMEKLEKQLQDRDAEVSKLKRDKEKLEGYTKQTLQIFQRKYFATTQDYKTKLREQTEKIQSLETELADYKVKAENDPLLSSPMYEVNLGVHNDPSSDTTHDGAIADEDSSGAVARKDVEDLRTVPARGYKI